MTAMDSPRDFGGFAFTMGSLVGHRIWEARAQDGTLTGVTFRIPWTTGVNVALCHRPGCQCNDCQRIVYFQNPLPPPGNPSDELHMMEHKSGCGFYAYFDGFNNSFDTMLCNGKRGPRIDGVIEGFGKTVVGPRGFRCEKAKILALHIPSKQPLLTWTLHDLGVVHERVRARYPDVPIYDSYDEMTTLHPASSPIENEEES